MNKYKLIVFDMDGVLVDANSSWVVIHDHFGVNNDVSLELYLKEEIDDLEFMRRDIALWRSCQPELHIKHIREILEKEPIMDGVPEVFDAVAKMGMKTAIVSGGIDILAEKVCGVVKCDLQKSNGLAVDRDGFLSGEGILRVPVLHKELVVRRIQEMYGIDKVSTVSVGNSQVDVNMFAESALGIAFNPEDEKTKEAADVVVEGKDLALILECLK